MEVNKKMSEKINKVLKEGICHDCNAKEGQLHVLGCDMEICPACGGQLISCGCYQSEGDVVKIAAYRIPYVVIPTQCRRCGVLCPDFFNVPDEEWQKYVIPPLQRKVLCRVCYDYFKRLFPNGWKAVKFKFPKGWVPHAEETARRRLKQLGVE